MANDSEEKTSTTHEVTRTAASIFGALNQLKKWREVQLAECQEKQFIESQKLLQLYNDNQKQREQVLENGEKHQHPEPEIESKAKTNVPELSDISSISLVNDLDACDALQDSSITGHLQRCFNDSTNSNVSVVGNKVQHAPEKVPVFSELRNPQFSDKNPEDKNAPLAETGMTNGVTKPKRPFLKKGSGLLRFKPKSTNSSQISIDKEPTKVKKYLPQKTLKLKPALRKPDVPSEKVKQIRFDITDSDDEDIRAEMQYNFQSEIPTSKTDTDDKIHKRNSENPSSSASSVSPENNKCISTVAGNENFTMSEESDGLHEFELIEQLAQNSSFNSDSSIVQRVIQGESIKPSSSGENCSSMISQNPTSSGNNVHVSTSKNLNYPEIVGLSKCLEEIGAQKQKLHEVICDINPRIESLQKEISCDKKMPFEDGDISDRCSTPVNFEDENPVSECNTVNGSSDFEVSPQAHANHFVSHPGDLINAPECSCKTCDDFYPTEELAQACSNEEECTCNCPGETYENEPDCDEKSKIHAKLLELQKEIEIYQQLNAHLSSVCKEKDNIVRKLQKERDDFTKFKEAELQKLNAHIEKEHQQIKRQKETFNRYQKLRTHPTKKERDELSSLRSEIEKLHDDLKKQKIKYNNDTRRLKTRLENTEKERDSFKLENIRLEGQNQDLLDTLKARMKKDIKYLSGEGNHIHNNDNTKHTVEKRDAECQTEEKDSNIYQSSSQSGPNSADVKKPKKHCDSFSELQKQDIIVTDKDSNIQEKNIPENNSFHPEQSDLNNKFDDISKRNIEKGSSNANLSVISVSCDNEFKEINNGITIERIYSSGEREIIHKNGTRKFISADGTMKKIFFHNGDIKEVHSDGRIINTFLNGVVETRLPDDTKITKYPNGRIHRSSPNGEQEIKYPDGIIQNIFPNGSEEIRTADGNIIKNLSDGTQIIESSNGQRIITTSTYKKIEFPNGSIKIIYNDGKQETRYSNGRIRIKDKEGKIIIDTKYISA